MQFIVNVELCDNIHSTTIHSYISSVHINALRIFFLFSFNICILSLYFMITIKKKSNFSFFFLIGSFLFIFCSEALKMYWFFLLFFFFLALNWWQIKNTKIILIRKNLYIRWGMFCECCKRKQQYFFWKKKNVSILGHRKNHKQKQRKKSRPN